MENEIKISILHKHIQMNTLKQKIKYAFAGLIQYGAKLNREEEICHTAVLFENKKEKYVFESLGSGLRLIKFSEFEKEIKSQNAKCFADEISYVSKEIYENRILPKLKEWIACNDKYPFKKALSSFSLPSNVKFRHKLLLKIVRFVAFLIPSKGYFYCTEIMALIMRDVIFVGRIAINENPSKVLAKIKKIGASKIQPSNFYNITNQAFKII
jgi:hypothetical protein